MTPACMDKDPRLFDSTKERDHLRARAICGGCERRSTCITEAEQIAALHPTNPSRRGPTGTWGGLLWVRGKVVTP